MSRIDTAGQLIVGESYWIFPKDKSVPAKGVLVEVKLDQLTALGNEVKYIGNHVWCIPGNNQVLDKYMVFGPVVKPTVNGLQELVEEYRDIAAINSEICFNELMSNEIVEEAKAQTYNEKYRNVEWGITTFFVNYLGSKVELPIAEVYLDNRIMPYKYAYNVPEAISIARRAIDIFIDDPQRFEAEYRSKIEKEEAESVRNRDRAGQDACVAGVCDEPVTQANLMDGLGLKPATDIAAPTAKVDPDEGIPVIDVEDEDEIPF